MIRTKEEILDMMNSRFAEDTSDETLSFIEDITDTIDDLTARGADSTDWEEKYNKLDADWRKKYRDRFFKASYEEDEDEYEDGDEEGDETPLKKTYEELFEEVK